MFKMVDDNPDICNPTGATLLELRKRLAWTQPQLAEYLGINERTVRSHERDYHRLRLELWQYKKLHQLMTKVGMTVDDLPDPPR